MSGVTSAGDKVGALRDCQHLASAIELTNSKMAELVTDFDSMPLALLTKSTICALCEMMDLTKIKENDFRLLVNLLKLTYAQEKKLKKEVERASYKSMTLFLLRKWVAKEDVCVQTLFELLEVNERTDVIQEIMPLAEEDLQRAKKEGEAALLRIRESTAEPWDGILLPTVDETLFSSDLFHPGRTFDAFISYNPSSCHDKAKMEALRRDLCCLEITSGTGEKRFLDVVVGADELLSGTSLSKSLVRAIRYRCKRVVLLISRSFASSDECVFQMQIAKGLDLAARFRKVIPVLIQKGAELPDEIFNLCAIDLTDPARWRAEVQRLAASLVA